MAKQLPLIEVTELDLAEAVELIRAYLDHADRLPLIEVSEFELAEEVA